MQFLASLPTFENDQACKSVWRSFERALGGVDGICYYKHPVIAWAHSIPDLTLMARQFEPIAIKCEAWNLDEIESIDEEKWGVSGSLINSPIQDLDDYTTGLKHKFERERLLRRKINPISALALPLISKNEFEQKFGHSLPPYAKVIWKDLKTNDVLKEGSELSSTEWALAKSVFQGVNPLNKNLDRLPASGNTKGKAIRFLEKDIALLDEEQHKVAIQIAPGPQRIRGLAGTGKTVVLAMKAANIHLRYPEKKILFTFNTQSLYNQTKSLISRFYRTHSDEDPNWEKLHIRHAWGGKSRPGVYFDVCKRSGEIPMILRNAKGRDPNFPFRACCNHALDFAIKPLYDHVLIDEAQDFPKEYFRLLYKLTKEPKSICWAYDELQSLAALEVPNPKDLFGVSENGIPLISLEGEDYPGGIEKDFVLHRSYRCSKEVLMLAHGIGLGIHAPKGCVQMLVDKQSWKSIGYEVRKGNLIEGEETEIFRPSENSPNRLTEIYSGDQKILEVKDFEDREEELNWVAKEIKNDIEVEEVCPEQIVVIGFDNPKDNLMKLQAKLLGLGVDSIIPGIGGLAWEFGETDMVTLSTIFRAKGNEAPNVYIINFDALYGYAEEIENRNKAFSSISRSKGWVRITGSGRQMKEVRNEVERILNDIPFFKFVFPNISGLRRLDASETTRRRKELKRAKDSLRALTEVDREALGFLDPEQIKQLKEALREIPDES